MLPKAARAERFMQLSGAAPLSCGALSFGWLLPCGVHRSFLGMAFTVTRQVPWHEGQVTLS
jgi:hypothetical protein